MSDNEEKIMAVIESIMIAEDMDYEDEAREYWSAIKEIVGIIEGSK